jgi:tetrathionate reductase subunit B
MKVLVIDTSICNGCFNCQIACKDEFVGNDWPPYSLSEPDIGQFWMKVDQKVRGSVPKVKVAYTCQPCMHCDDAPCIKAATKGAVYKRKDGIVIIDPVKSVGQKQLVAACPYGAIYWNDTLNIPQKCTMCAHLLDNEQLAGGIVTPRCVDACQTGALKFGEEADLQPLISQAEVLHPEYGTKPRVYYLNLPKPFITGALLDPVADECVEGADVTATDLATGEVYATKSDNYGDFWFEGLQPDHVYSVNIELAGHYSKMFGAVSTGKDVNLGDIPIYKK